MNAIILIWLVGWAFSTLVYLVAIGPGFRRHARTAGVVFEIFHYVIRVALMFMVWPLMVTAGCFLLAGRREVAEPSNRPLL